MFQTFLQPFGPISDQFLREQQCASRRLCPGMRQHATEFEIPLMSKDEKADLFKNEHVRKKKI